MASKPGPKKEVPKTITKMRPVKVNGAKMDVKRKAVQDRDGDDFSYYHEGRNEPKPPDACLVSAVKYRAPTWEKVTMTAKNKAEREATMASNMAAMFGDGGKAGKDYDNEPRGIPLSADHEEYRKGLMK